MNKKRDATKDMVQQNTDVPKPRRSRSGGISAPDAGQRPTISLSNLTPEELMEQIPSNDRLKRLFGLKTDPGALGLMITTLNGLGLAGSTYRDFVFAMAAELEPTDAVEAMLVAQMGVTHAAMMAASQRSWDANGVEAREAYDRIMNRLARTFLAQVDQLRRYRTGGSQLVRVEHVTVNAGGQAIVGNVTGGGRKREKAR